MLKVTENEEALVFNFHPRMDTANTQAAEKEINEKINATTKSILFDLEGVGFISSYFLRICINTLKTVGAERYKLQNVSSDIKKVFMIAGYDKYITIL